MTRKKYEDDYGMSKNDSNVSLDAAMMMCINELTDTPPEKVINDVHKQLIVKFQPAMKHVAENGFNFLRALHNVQKMSEEYTKSIDTLAESGTKAFAAAKERAAELKEISTCMREVNRRHKEAMIKFSALVAKINDYGQDEKDKLKRFHRQFESREREMKKKVRKEKLGSDAMKEFYIKERNLALRQQHQRYKFFVEKHNEWLRDYVTLFVAFRQLYTDVPLPPANDTTNPAATRPNMMLDDEGYVAPGAYSDGTNSIRTADQQSLNRENYPPIPSVHGARAEPMRDHEAFFNENFVIQNAEPEFREPDRSPTMPLSPGVRIRYRDSTRQVHKVDKAISVKPTEMAEKTIDRVKFKDASTITTNFTNNLQEPIEPARFRPSSLMLEDKSLPTTPNLRPNVSEKIVSLSMNALNESSDDEEKPTAKDVMFRASNLNAIPTAFVQQPFLNSDYGKILECIHDFHGRTATQLSLRNGEKVALIKCGSKGWVFAKNIKTQRTGWFPSRYVRIPEETSENDTDHL